mmetsp:Transcript_61127/g.126648  ORF Transcript_61127/g.126648 Transcript_61127/m.126648 type:complete len:311 (+) Transcript_61127:46-978(+)|eukprot:s2221_g13.t1
MAGVRPALRHFRKGSCVGLLTLLLASAHAFVHAQLGAGLSRSQTHLRASTRRDVLALLPLAQALHAGSAEALDSALSGKKVVVLGGSGFVGRRICQRLVAEGAQVTSISRTGGPPSKVGDWASSVAWKKKDVLTAYLVPEMTGAGAVVSAIGSIGSADDEQGNGATNEAAVAAAAKAGVKRFVLVSASKDVGEAGVDAVFGPYVKGKQRAEAAVKAKFSDSSLVLQPSFIYGGDEFSATPPRVAGWYGEKVENLLATDLFRAVASASPAFLRLALSPPLAVDDVAKAAVAGAAGRATGILESHDAILAAR